MRGTNTFRNTNAYCQINYYINLFYIDYINIKTM